MSRIALAFSLVTALSSLAVAAPSFATAPPDAPVTAPVAPPVEVPLADRVDTSVSRAPITRASLRASVRAMLIENRAANLARFRAYRLAGSYPSNVYTGSTLNVWRDPDGKFCAAATIIRSSGDTALVEQIAEDNNFIRLATVTSGPLMDWILMSGLTQAELALIQRPFMPVTNRPQLEEPITASISATLRAKEDARLARLYKRIDATLVRNHRTSLDAAVDRLMKNPTLARQLVHGDRSASNS